jgi:predicted AAA+ superfamily ATPase
VTCEPFRDADELRNVLADVLAAIGTGNEQTWLFVDEITYVPDWDRVVKFLADTGALERCCLLLTGSDHVVIQDSLKRLPGRRGRAAVTDFHLRPLSFAEFVRLRGNVMAAEIDVVATAPLEAMPTASARGLDVLEQELLSYHLTGGFLAAINDLARDGVVAPATLRIYSDWIRGDILRLDRTERYLREILRGISRRYGSQITWNSLAKELSIDHPKTVSDYVAILERMDAAVVVPAVAEHQRGPAPKTARKVFFADPFIHRASLAWLGEPDGEIASDQRMQRDLEATFSAHVQRFAEGFYVKGAGEIDCAWYEGRHLQFVEVKWATQLRPEEMKEIRRRGRGVVACRTREARQLDGLTILPAAVVLLRVAQMSSKRG